MSSVATTTLVNVPHPNLENPNKKNFDPRFGFAYDLFADHKTALRGGFAITHSPVFVAQYNPQFTAAKLTAAAAYQVPTQFHAAYEPNFFGSLTGVGADTGSRLAAGALNNPVVYNRLGSGLSVSQLITDFGRTGNLISSAKLRAQAQDQATETTRADILLAVSR